uniref:Transposase (Putative), gypsy type n=1 Tax=Tanacetum cinerariifolium TaxID=118510 RepID=A0A699HC59_TANCI|nr:hypothetical protein [Tanacetum cinerariifolium]
MVANTIDVVTSVLTQRELDLFSSMYNILDDLYLELLGHDDVIQYSPKGKIGFMSTLIAMVGCLSLNVLVCPIFVPWYNDDSIKRDPLPFDDLVDPPLLEKLNDNRTLIRKCPNTFLCLVGLSRSFVDMDIRPTLIGRDKNDMGLLDFVKFTDPFKVKTVERNLTDGEVPLLTETAYMVVAHSDQTIHLVSHTIADEIREHSGKNKRKVRFSNVLPPVKKARTEVMRINEPVVTTTDSGSTHDGDARTRRPSACYVVLTFSSENEDVDTIASPNTTPHKVGSLNPHVQMGVEDVGAGVVNEIVYTSLPENDVASLLGNRVRSSSSPPNDGSQIDDFLKSQTIDTATARDIFVSHCGKDYAKNRQLKPGNIGHKIGSLHQKPDQRAFFYKDQANKAKIKGKCEIQMQGLKVSNQQSLNPGTKSAKRVNFYYKWAIKPEGPEVPFFKLIYKGKLSSDDLVMCRNLIDHVSLPGFWASLCNRHDSSFLDPLNVNSAQHTCMMSELRLRYKHAILKREKFEQKFVRGCEVIQQRDAEISSLKAVVEKAQGEAAEVIKLRKWVSELKFAVVVKLNEIGSLNARNAELLRTVSGLELVCDGLKSQVTRLETDCKSLRDDIVGEAKLKEQFSSMQDAAAKRFDDRSAALGKVISLAIDKGIQEGLEVGIEHGRVGRSLSEVAAYDFEVEAAYVAAALTTSYARCERHQKACLEVGGLSQPSQGGSLTVVDLQASGAANVGGTTPPHDDMFDATILDNPADS